MFTGGWFHDILFYGESGNPPLHVTAGDQQPWQVLCHNLAKLKSGGEKPGISADNGSRAEVSMGFNGIQWGAPMHAMSCDFENFRYQILSFDHPMTLDLKGLQRYVWRAGKASSRGVSLFDSVPQNPKKDNQIIIIEKSKCWLGASPIFKQTQQTLQSCWVFDDP